MSNDDDPQRPFARRYVGTEQSLDKSEQIASKLGFTMDREAVRHQARDLLSLYFSDIQKALPAICQHITFDDFATEHMDVFAHHADGQPGVFFDQHFSQWNFRINTTIVIFAFFDLTHSQMQDLGELLEKQLMQWHDPLMHEALREEEWPWVDGFVEAMPLANALSLAMDVFAMCHEIAHHHLKHLDVDMAIQHELEADALAYEFFLILQEKADRLQYAKLDAKVLVAPCLSFGYVDLLERWSAQQGGLQQVPESLTHPRGTQRRKALMDRYAHRWSAGARELYDVLNECLEDFSRGLGIAHIG